MGHTTREMTEMMTIPTLFRIQRTEARRRRNTHVQLRLPFDTLASVCPPRIALKMQNPTPDARLRMLARKTPRYLSPQP